MLGYVPLASLQGFGTEGILSWFQAKGAGVGRRGSLAIAQLPLGLSLQSLGAR